MIINLNISYLKVIDKFSIDNNNWYIYPLLEMGNLNIFYIIEDE